MGLEKFSERYLTAFPVKMCQDKKKTCPIQLLLGQVIIYLTCGATRLGMITYPLCAY